MTNITKDQFVALAREIGTPYVNRHYPGQTSFGFTEDTLLAFAQAAFKLGRNAGLEDCKSLITKLDSYVVGLKPYEIANALDALKDNTP